MTTARGLDAVYYLAKDFPRAIGFYENGLGLKVATKFEKSVEFELPDGSAFGIGFQAGFWSPGGGALFAVDDVGAAVAQVREQGGKVHGDVMESAVCFIAWCEDTEGNTFALHKRKI